jgi:hypothetical protein
MIVNPNIEILGEVEVTTKKDSQNTGEGFSLADSNTENQTIVKKNLDGSVYQLPDHVIKGQELNSATLLSELDNTAARKALDGSIYRSPDIIHDQKSEIVTNDYFNNLPNSTVGNAGANITGLDQILDGSIYQSSDILIHDNELTVIAEGTEVLLTLISDGIGRNESLINSFGAFTESEFLQVFNSSFNDFNLQYSNGSDISATISFATSFHSVGVSQHADGIVDLSVRLLPIGAYANPYLSNISSNNAQSVVAELTNTQSFRNIAQLESAKAFFPADHIGSSNRNAPLLNTALLTNSTAKLEGGQSSRTIEAVNNTYLFASEISKRNILLTENQSGDTLWYRDFEISRASLNDLENRLSSSEFIQSNNIQRVFINGELLWKKEA